MIQAEAEDTRAGGDDFLVAMENPPDESDADHPAERPRELQ